MFKFKTMGSGLKSRTLQRCVGVLASGFIVWLSLILFAPPSLRAEIPVIDTAALGQMVQQYVQMARQLSALYTQITLLEQQVKSVTGHYGQGSLGGPVNPWGETSWGEIAEMVSQGVNPGDGAQVRAYRSARERYQNQFPALSSQLQSSNPRMSAAYQQTYSDAMTGMGLGEATFNQINTQLEDIQTLKDRIDQTDNLKSAMDLNSAINARVAQINGQILRTQAAQLRLQAASQNSAANAYAAQAEFFAK